MTGGGGGGGMNWEIGIDMYRLMWIKWLTNKNLLYKKINKRKKLNYVNLQLNIILKTKLILKRHQFLIILLHFTVINTLVYVYCICTVEIVCNGVTLYLFPILYSH